MIYNVFGGALNLAQSITEMSSTIYDWSACWSVAHAQYCSYLVVDL